MLLRRSLNRELNRLANSDPWRFGCLEYSLINRIQHEKQANRFIFDRTFIRRATCLVSYTSGGDHDRDQRHARVV